MKFSESAGILRLVDSNEVHQHGFREGGGRVRWARPLATDGNVQDDIKRMVENPFHPGGKPGRRERRIQLSIDKEANDSWFPFDCENVEAVGEVDTAGEFVHRCEVAVARIPRSVHRAMYGGRLFADILHDVDLAAGGPTDLPEVISDEPECRPHALSARNFDARFEASIGLIEKPLRRHPC